MIEKELLDKIDLISKNLDKHYLNLKNSEIELVFSRVIKLNEEVGELNKEILQKFYKGRIDNFDEKNLELEFADVIITTLLLAKSINIDINKSLEAKINIIKNRGGI